MFYVDAVGGHWYCEADDDGDGGGRSVPGRGQGEDLDGRQSRSPHSRTSQLYDYFLETFIKRHVSVKNLTKGDNNIK